MTIADCTCPGCGVQLPLIIGPTHPYMEASPACWQAYGVVLAREYSHWELADIHRLSVDAYAVQHPGGTSRQAIQSVGFHLIRLCLALERGLAPERANDAMLKVSKRKATYIHLARPPSLGSVTLLDVYRTYTLDQHRVVVRGWAQSAWQAWECHHAQVRRWADTVS